VNLAINRAEAMICSASFIENARNRYHGDAGWDQDIHVIHYTVLFDGETRRRRARRLSGGLEPILATACPIRFYRLYQQDCKVNLRGTPGSPQNHRT